MSKSDQKLFLIENYFSANSMKVNLSKQTVIIVCVVIKI